MSEIWTPRKLDRDDADIDMNEGQLWSTGNIGLNANILSFWENAAHLLFEFGFLAFSINKYQ